MACFFSFFTGTILFMATHGVKFIKHQSLEQANNPTKKKILDEITEETSFTTIFPADLYLVYHNLKPARDYKS